MHYVRGKYGICSVAHTASSGSSPSTKVSALQIRSAMHSTCSVSKSQLTHLYSREPLGHNALSKIVSSMYASAGISGFRTDHSLRATSATRLYAAGVEGQLIMERTGHRSVEGVL